MRIGEHNYIQQLQLQNDVLLGIWNHIDSFDESRNTFKNWAAVIAKYKSIDYLRKCSQKIQYTEIEEAMIPKEDLELRRLIDGTLSEELERLLSCLNEKDRALFLKLYVEEKSMDEISRETGMEKAVIYNRLSRGKQRMKRQHLKEREA